MSLIIIIIINNTLKEGTTLYHHCNNYYIHFTAFFSRITRVNQHQKSRIILVKPICIYWSKR